MKIVDIKECPEHLEQVCDWHQAEWSHLNPGQSWEDRLVLMKEDLKDAAVPSTYVAIEGDILLGSAAILASDMAIHKELTPWLASVFVGPTHRRQGIGTELVKYIMQVAKDNGESALYLYTPDAKAFYARLGWKVWSQLQYHGEDVTIMVYNYGN